MTNQDKKNINKMGSKVAAEQARFIKKRKHSVFYSCAGTPH
jgi:hypothetical protein